jgi:DNA replication protein DnaC
MIEQTKQILNSMRCHGILAALDIRLAEATTQGWGHTEFLSAIMTDEKLYRDNLRTNRRIKAAHFRTDASFENLEVTSKRNLTRTQTQDLKTLKFITDPRNILILGPTGVGKTFLATAIGNQSCREGFTCLFFGMNLFMERLALHRAEGTFLRFRDRLIRCDLLILDDLGIKTIPPEVVQDLYDILEERYQSKSTLITSQLPFNNWKEVIEDTVALEAILDRLIHGSITIQLAGESYRKNRNKKEKLDEHRGPVEINSH